MADENSDKDYLDSAKEHLNAAVEDLKAGTEKVAGNLEQSVLKGIDNAADTLIETLFKIKKAIKTASADDKPKDD